MDLKVGDYVSFNYSTSFYVGKIVKEESTRWIVKCTVYGNSIHKCNGFFNKAIGLYLYTNFYDFRNVKTISKFDFLAESIK